MDQSVAIVLLRASQQTTNLMDIRDIIVGRLEYTHNTRHLAKYYSLSPYFFCI